MHKAEIPQDRHPGRTRQALCGCAVCLRMSLHTWELTSAGGSVGWYVHIPTSPLSPHEAAGGVGVSLQHTQSDMSILPCLCVHWLPDSCLLCVIACEHGTQLCVYTLSGHPCVCMIEYTCLRFRHACHVWLMGCWGSNSGLLRARQALYQLSYTPSPKKKSLQMFIIVVYLCVCMHMWLCMHRYLQSQEGDN